MNGADFEQSVQKIGLEIYDLVGKEIPSVFQMKRWMGKFLEWAMKDEDFKVRLFRFVDVLPALKSDALVVAVMKEYFSSENTPAIMRQTVRRLSGAGILPGMAVSAIRGAVESMAYQFIAGKDPDDAMAALRSLRNQGLASSVDLLGEAVLSEREAGEYAERHMALLHTIAPRIDGLKANPILDQDNYGDLPRLDVSLKITAFYSQIDPIAWESSLERTGNAIAPTMKAAKELGVSLTVDMEHSHLKDFTIALFKKLMDENPDFHSGGLALQTYLKDSEQDLRDVVDWLRARKRRALLRLVKGAYWDYEHVVNRRLGWPVPVFGNKGQTDANFELMTQLLLENTDCVRPAIATHNIRSISYAIAVAEKLGLPRNAFEFQMIHGMAEPVRAALQKMGFRIRVYTPIGALIPGMGYLIRRLLENTYDDSYLRRAFYEGEAISELMRKPEPGPESPWKPKPGFSNEPPTDFSKADSRLKMAQALEASRRGLGANCPLIIGGKDVESPNKAISLNPARPQETIGTISQAGPEHVAEAVQMGRAAWEGWSRISVEERAEYLFAAAREMRKRKFDLAALEVYEVGKAWSEADGDVAEAIDFLEYYAREAVKICNPRTLGDYPGERNLYVHRPKGLGLVVSPWNFPIAIPTGMLAAAIATGNCVIFKPSGLSPVCGWEICNVFKTVGLPPGVLQFLPGPGAEIGNALVRHPDVDFVAFTGSKEVGLEIVRLAGDTQASQRNVKRVIAEMGGKNAIIVDETADLDEAVKGVLDSAIGYQGQKCSACSRVIVVGALKEDFSARLKDALASVNIGPPEDPQNLMGPVIDKQAFDKIKKYIEIGKADGYLLSGGDCDSQAGYYMGPHLFADLKPDSRLLQEEVFGPVLVIMAAQDLDHAIGLANGTPYALTGGLCSRSPGAIAKVQEEFRVGNLYINRKITGALVGRHPFGGFGMSGVGSKAGGPEYLMQFTNPVSISENTLRRGFAPKDADS
jgi:RHH-type proline utilization regulon transcriptional repressor/proline dehydrogenase/delta 1-pyrroline-5-carboxylate dehydrogenase